MIHMSHVFFFQMRRSSIVCEVPPSTPPPFFSFPNATRTGAHANTFDRGQRARPIPDTRPILATTARRAARVLPTNVGGRSSRLRFHRSEGADRFYDADDHPRVIVTARIGSDPKNDAAEGVKHVRRHDDVFG